MKNHRSYSLFTITSSLVFAAALSGPAKTFDWPIDAPTAGARQFTAYHGETVRFNLRLGGAMTNLAPVCIYYQTNGMGRAEWFGPVPGTVFHPTNDCGAAFYRFFILCNDPDGKDYTANGSLRLLDSPGFVPNEVPLPAQTLDFARIEVLNPPWGEGPGNYEAVSNAAMNALSTTGGVFKAGAKLFFGELDETPGSGVEISEEGIRLVDDSIIISSDDNSIEIESTDVLIDESRLVFNHEDGEDYSMRDIRESLDAATETNAAQSAALASQASQLSHQSQSITTLGGQVNAIGAHLNAEDARFVSTNYNSATHMPEAYVEVKLTNGWFTIWREMTRWDWFLGIYNNDFAALSAALATKGEKEYAFYDGVTGQPAPDGFFWIAQPRVAICAGASYQRYVDTGGAVWVLESNGMVADVNGTTNGYFRISDDEGNSQFEIVKGSSRTVVAVPGAMTSASVMSVTHWFTTYAVTNATSAPVAMFSRSITSPEWYAETDGGCPCNVSWTNPESGVYVCEWWAKGAEPQMYMKAKYGQGTESRIVQSAPVEMQYIFVNGVKYALGTATIDGRTVLTLTP